MKNYYKKTEKIICDLLFPRRCPLCDRVIGGSKTFLCKECKGTVSAIREPRCRKCGKQLRKEEEEYCYDCKTKRHLFDKGIALFSYHQVANSIYRFKYGGRAEYAGFYADEIVRHFKEEILSMKAQALIPVPLHKKRQRKEDIIRQLFWQKNFQRLQIRWRKNW